MDSGSPINSKHNEYEEVHNQKQSGKTAKYQKQREGVNSRQDEKQKQRQNLIYSIATHTQLTSQWNPKDSAMLSLNCEEKIMSASIYTPR